MNAMAVSTRMIPVLPPACAAGVPTTAARGGLLIPTEFGFTVAEVSTFHATVHLPMYPEDIPDTHFSKIRILLQSDRIELPPGDDEEITVTVKNIGKRTISTDPTVIVSPYRGYVFDEGRIVMGPAIAELETYSGGMFSFAVGSLATQNAGTTTYRSHSPMNALSQMCHPQDRTDLRRRTSSPFVARQISVVTVSPSDGSVVGDRRGQTCTTKDVAGIASTTCQHRCPDWRRGT